MVLDFVVNQLPKQLRRHYEGKLDTITMVQFSQEGRTPICYIDLNDGKYDHWEWHRVAKGYNNWVLVEAGATAEKESQECEVTTAS